MKKHIQIFLILISVFLAGCKTQSQSIPTEEVVIKDTITSIPTITETKIPKNTPAPTLPPTFTPTQEPSETPSPSLTSTVPTPETTLSILDLDVGQTGISDKADVEFFAQGGNMLFYSLNAINDSKSVQWASTLNDKNETEYPPEPTYNDCLNLVDTYDTDNEPDYVCVLTSDENVSRIKLEEYNPLGASVISIRISFITWLKES